MITRVIAIPRRNRDGRLRFCLSSIKFLAFPVVDEQRRIVGLVDVNVFTEEVSTSRNASNGTKFPDHRFSRVAGARCISAESFSFRFPWLTATIGSGTLCALLASGYEATLAKSLVLAFFLTLVLGLGRA